MDPVHPATIQRLLNEKCLSQETNEFDRKLFMDSTMTIGSLLLETEQERRKADQERARAEMAEYRLSRVRIDLLKEKHKLNSRGLMEEFEKELRNWLANDGADSLEALVRKNRTDLWTLTLNRSEKKYSDLLQSLLKLYPDALKKKKGKQVEGVVTTLCEFYSRISHQIHQHLEPIEDGEKGIIIWKSSDVDPDAKLVAYFADQLGLKYIVSDSASF